MGSQSSDSFEAPTREGKDYDPDGYKQLASVRFIMSWLAGIGFIFIVLFTLAVISDNASPTPLLFLFVIVFIVLGTGGVFYNSMLDDHKLKVFEAKKAESEQAIKITELHGKDLKEAKKLLEEQGKLVEEIQKAQSMGDIIISNNHAPIVISSTITGSFNTISTTEPDLANAIKVLGGFIEKSGNTEAAVYFDELHQQIASEDRNKVTLKALWNGIKSSLPSVEKLTEVVGKITALFA